MTKFLAGVIVGAALWWFWWGPTIEAADREEVSP